MSSPEQAIAPNTVAVAVVQGPAWQATVPAATIAAPGTIAASGTFTTGPIQTNGNPHVAVSAQLSQTGSISVQRFLDAGAVIPTGAATTQALTAGTLAVLDNLGTIVFQSIEVSIINGAGSVGTLTNMSIVLQSK